LEKEKDRQYNSIVKPNEFSLAILEQKKKEKPVPEQDVFTRLN